MNKMPQAPPSVVLAVLEARGLVVSEAQRAQVLAERDLATLEGWLRKAATATRAAAVFSRS